MKRFTLLSWLVACTWVLGPVTAHADLVLGPISDFQDGTDQGWTGGTVAVVANSGPNGAGDFALELANGGVANNFAMFNTDVNGNIAADVTAISTDMWRPSGEATAEIRLVLFDSVGNRWTSNAAAQVSGDGAWKNYRFSILEADLTRVVGGGTYSDLVANLNRIMFRYDPGTPSGNGAPLDGVVRFDNIAAIPEPATAGLAGVCLLWCGLHRRRRGA